MEPSAAGGDRRPSPPSGGCQPPPPPPGGWLAGLVSGAGRILTAVLGPDSSLSGAGSTDDASSDGASPSSASSSRSSFRPQAYNGCTDHVCSLLLPPKNNQLNQIEKETVLKDYAEASLAIVSDIEPKDAIMQLLMQETYSRSECSTLIKIIQDRVVNPDSCGIVDVGALPISRKAGRLPTVGYSSFSPDVSSPSTSSLLIHGNGIDDSATAGAAPTLTIADQVFFNHNADMVKPVLKRNYSVSGDTPEDLRRVRPKINGNSLNISKFKQVDVIRNHPAVVSKLNTVDHNSFDGMPRVEKKLLSDVPLGTKNLAYPDIIAKVESVEKNLDVPYKPSAVPHFDLSSSQAVGDQKNYDYTFMNSCSNKDLKNGLPLKVELLNAHIPFEQKMVDLSHQKHEQAACDDSGSVSKLMFMEDIEAAPCLPIVVQLQNSTKNLRRKQPSSQRTTPASASTRSPAKGTRRKNIDGTILSEIGSLEQSAPPLMEKQDPDYVPEKRPVGRPRKGR